MSPRGISGKVQTVLGPIEPGELGITVTHEHLLIDLRCYFIMPEEASKRYYVDRPLTMDMLGMVWRGFFYMRDQQVLLDERAAIEEVLKYKHAGGQSLVDTTSLGIARDPLALARISRATGLNVIMGGSHYVPVAHPPNMDRRSEEEIATQIINDVTVGVGDTGVKTGVIGEIGNFYPLSENEKKVLRASAYAQKRTGAPILVHPGIHPDAVLEIMTILAKAGADPRHVIMGHLDAIRPMSAIKDLAQTGCFVEYDRFGSEDTSFDYEVGETRVDPVSDVQRMESLEYLVSEGFGDRLLIAHDICTKADTTRYGGKGYPHILENVLPRMRKRGFSQKQLDAILIHNPARALAFA
jgi:phosphotriesterase-related protein